MTRQIKYQVFDFKEKKMYPVSSLELNHDAIQGIVSIKIFDSTKTRSDEMIRDLPLENAKEHNSRAYSIREFTGLLDRNGIEIYERDIVNVYHASEYMEPKDYEGENTDDPKNEHWNKTNAFVCKQEVKWSEDGGYFCAEDTGEYCPPLGSQDDVIIEIIGNIYSSPEPLK